MNQPIGYKEAFGYFRLGLVTGFVDKTMLIAWADREIINHPVAEPEIVELALCGKRPYSEIIWLLGQFEHGSDYQTSINLILARASLLLEQANSPVSDIIMGLRLLIEEEWLAKEIKVQLRDLKHNLEQFQQAAISHETLTGQLHAFLAPYRQYQAYLPANTDEFKT